MRGVVARNLGLECLEPFYEPIVKLVFAKYLKLAERCLHKLRATKNNDQIVTFQQLPRSSGVQANIDVLAGMLEWIRCVAASPKRGVSPCRAYHPRHT
jgi:hypothetical protein